MEKLLGHHVEDIVTGRDGIVTSIIRWISDCDSVLVEDKEGTFVTENLRLELLDDGIADRVPDTIYQAADEYLANLGRHGRDKITGYEGVAIGVHVNAFRSAQYCMQAPSVDNNYGKISSMDCGQIEFDDNDELVIDPSEIQGRHSGGFNYIPKGIFEAFI